MAYKITIKVDEEKLSGDELKQAARYVSDALSKMGIGHHIECQIDKMKLFGITRNFLIPVQH